MGLRLYDTARREIVPFDPPSMVRMYVCGITPYDSTHLGHAATYINYDLLIRRLEELGHEVRMVRNITDVDDSILPKARELGVPYLELAEAETARFQGDMAALELRPPVAEPRATEAVPGIIDCVGRLLDKGHAYLSGGSAYFDVSTFPDFGKLSHYPEDRMVKLARARGGNPDDPHRRAPLDFVLWQPSLADEPAWRAPFGAGRPGWHIECSCMVLHEHGPTIDLHGGGTDLVFPHHECEIAQSESLTGEPFARHWMHSAMVSYEGEKMSKSLGNLVFVSDLLKVADPRAIRLALTRHHYRSGFEWYDTDLDEAVALLHRLLAAAEKPDGPDPAPFAARVRDAIDNDLDTPRALEALDDLTSAILSGGSDATAPAALRELGSLVRLPRRRSGGPEGVGTSHGLWRAGGRSRVDMSNQITVTLPDGSERVVVPGTTPLDIASGIGPRLAKAALAAKADGEWIDLDRRLDHDVALALITPESDDGREVLRHSTAHVLAEAVTQLFPGAKYAIGPAIADGFYYDFELPGGETFSDEVLERIEQRMREIVKHDEKFVRAELSYDDALAVFADQPYKREIIEKVRSGDATSEDAGEAGEAGGGVSVYRNAVDGEVAFTDLCRGPHVPSTKRLGAFKLTKVAGAYWRGNEKGPMLQRIYGTAWESKDALAEHLHRLEEAERRDHRKLGVELDLFSFPEEIGSGLAVFHPKGALVRRIMEEYSRERHETSGYDFVTSPHITKAGLFETSGHLDWYADGMFPPMHLDEGGHGGEGTTYYLKPMNCPFHVLIYKHRTRSYRELPLRYFEFGNVYRYEKSGVVHGLTRVRGMTQDDAHIFCTKEQMVPELKSLLDFVLDLLRDYGLDDFYLELSTKGEKAVGSDEEWAEATETLRVAAEGKGLDLVLDEGGGAFYGPKISVQAKDAIGRTWQMSTIQLDFQTPQRFDLHYVGADNERHQPIMIHRALFGSVERFFAVLLEHYAGAFPAWLAPVQATVLPVADRHDAYAYDVAARLKAAGFRPEVLDGAHGALGARIRRAKTEKVPHVLVVGDSDVEHGTVGVNRRGNDDPERDVAVDTFIAELATEVADHR